MLGKHSTRPHDTTRSNLTGSRSRRAGRSEGAVQKSALYRDHWLFAVTARIDLVATGPRRSARSIKSGDERDGFRPLDRTDQAAMARNEVPQLLMPVESLAGAADRPVGATEVSSVSPRPLTHTQNRSTRPNNTTCTNLTGSRPRLWGHLRLGVVSSQHDPSR